MKIKAHHVKMARAAARCYRINNRKTIRIVSGPEELGRSLRPAIALRSWFRAAKGKHQ